MTAQQQQQQPISGFSGDHVQRLVKVEADVGGLKESMTALTHNMDKGFRDISAEFKAKSAFNWQPVSILVVAVIAVAGWGWALFGSYQARTDAALAEQKLVSARFVDRADISDKFQTGKEKNDLRQTMTDARIERIERDVEALAKQIVPRGEHAEQWAHQRSKDEALQRQVEQVRQQLVDLNSPRDTVQSILRRLDDLDRAIAGRH